MRQTLSATALLVGTMIGAGIFALPSVAARAGVVPTLGLLGLLTVVVLGTYLMYVEILERTPERHRLPGYAALYLGTWGKVWAFGTVFFSGLGTLLVYLILTNVFSISLFGSGNGSWPALLLWFFLSAAAVAGIKTVARLELVMAGGLLLLMLLIIGNSMPRIDFTQLAVRGNGFDLFLPYGTILFALAGAIAIPQMRELFSGKGPGFRRAIVLGTLIPAVLYAVFVVSMVGVFGAGLIDADLLERLATLGRGIFIATLIFGLLAVATSFLATASYLLDVLRYDLGISRKHSAAILCVPLLFFVAGVRDFPVVVSFLGASLGLLDGALIVLIWLRLRKRAHRSFIFLFLGRAMIGLFAIGVLLELVALLR